jgi:SAM-dependent methyltransferase
MSTFPNRPRSTIRETVERYYAERLQRFGPTPRGVDWNSSESQALRFERLLVLLDEAVADAEISINDFGCGYGALLEVVRSRAGSAWYRGFDISSEMIEAAVALHAGDERSMFTSDLSALPLADYTFASGVFNVKLQHAVDEWQAYVMDTLSTINALSRRGFAFNMLSTYSDPARRRADLFYMNPLPLFDLCKQRFSARVALLHDYPLFEFTILVRK